jgi:lysophospholipase L1-like esterase
MVDKFMKRFLKRETIYAIALIIIGLVIAVVLGEFGLRTYYSIKNQNDKYYVWPPNLRKVSNPTPGTMPGVNGIAHFNVNSEGIRGDEISSGKQYRILTIGGSTTECLFLDQEKSWPYALQNKLNTPHLSKVWVGNVGKSGLSTREHYMHMKYLLPQYPRIDTVIILAGCNDLIRRLIEDKKYDPFFLDHYEYWKHRLIKGAFSETPYYKGKYRFRSGYYDELAIGSLIKQSMDMYSKRKMIQDEAGNMFVNFRNLRKGATKIVEDLPDLTSGLEEYKRNINAIIDIAQSRSVRIIFMTQPSLWKKEMTEQEKNLLWYGWIESFKSKTYYSETALLRGMQAYNDTLLQVCRARGVECIDLAKILPKNSTIFYDDVHFTDKGSLMTAEATFNYLNKEKRLPDEK